MYDLLLRGTQAWSTVDKSLLRTRTRKLSSDRDLASILVLRYTAVVLLNMTQSQDDTGRYWLRQRPHHSGVYYTTAVCMLDIVRCPDLEKSGCWQLTLETWRNGCRALERGFYRFLARAGCPVAQSIAVKRSFQLLIALEPPSFEQGNRLLIRTRRMVEANGQPVPDSGNGRGRHSSMPKVLTVRLDLIRTAGNSEVLHYRWSTLEQPWLRFTVIRLLDG